MLLLKLQLFWFLIVLSGRAHGKIIKSPTPIVLWHGMGDSCCFPFSLGSFKTFLQKQLPGVYVKSLKIGNNIIADYESGFFGNPNDHVEYVCDLLANNTQFANGYNAIGFSQGGQFLRAVAQRCPDPPMKVLISLGGQHQGIFGLPKCPSVKQATCEYIRKILNLEAYNPLVQCRLVQASYWHNPLDEDTYISDSIFLSDINNELINNEMYKKHLNQLEKLVLVKFLNDTIVQPKESQWFEFYKTGQDKEILPLKESRVYSTLGIDELERDGKLLFLSTEGDHLQFTEAWFLANLLPLLKN